MKGIKTEVVPDFYIGTIDMLKTEHNNPTTLFSIKKFINLENDLDFVGKWKEYTNIQQRNSVKFSENRNYINYLISITETIYKSLQEDEPIFVCCDSCNQKAPLVAVVFLIRYGNLSLQNALRSVISKLPHSPFQPTLEHLDILKTFM
jgi:protein-tyrosine phosphatase